MTVIRIITSEVLNTSKKIEQSGSHVKAVGGCIRSAGSHARTYDNNTFGPEVRAICNEADARALNIGGPLGAMAGNLALRANKFVTTDESFFSKIWNWITGLFDKDDQGKWTTGVEEGGVEESCSGEILESAATDQQPGTSSVDYNKSYTPTTAGKPDCVDYVKTIRNVPYISGFYSGAFRGKSGEDKHGTKYGQKPEPGAICVETAAGSAASGVAGHVSYVYSVAYDNEGNAVSFEIANANWSANPNDIAERSKVKTETFTWNAEKGAFFNSNGHRSPDCFVY